MNEWMTRVWWVYLNDYLHPRDSIETKRGKYGYDVTKEVKKKKTGSWKCNEEKEEEEEKKTRSRFDFIKIIY